MISDYMAEEIHRLAETCHRDARVVMDDDSVKIYIDSESRCLEVNRLGSGAWVVAKRDEASWDWRSFDLRPEMRESSPETVYAQAKKIDSLADFVNTYSTPAEAIKAAMEMPSPIPKGRDRSRRANADRLRERNLRRGL